MFRLAAFSVPVALLPLLVVHLVETLVTRSLLPEMATEMQRAADRPEQPERAMPILLVGRQGDGERTVPPLSLALRF